MPLVGTNVQAFRFKDLELEGSILSYSDELAIRLANHEYLKRDGGEVESLGAAQGRFAMQLVFMGPQAGARYQALVSSIRKNPRGLLIHPRLGRINVGCEGTSASESPADAVDTIYCTIKFIEDAVDAAIIVDSTTGPQERAGQALDANAALNQSVTARFGNQGDAILTAAVSAMTVLTSASSAFVTAALAAVQDSDPNLSLIPLLGNVQARQNAMLTSLANTLPVTLQSDVSLTPYRNQTRLIYASCYLLYLSVIAAKPPVTEFINPTAQPLAVILTTFYGKDASAKRPEVLVLNKIPNPHWIPVGFRMLPPQPSVRQ